MSRPGVEVYVSDAPPQREAPTAVDAYFIVGLTERGPVGEAVQVRSLPQFRQLFGNRVPYGLTYDAADIYFQEGGARAIVSRVVGPAATDATLTLAGTTGPCLTATLPAGEYAATWFIGVAAGIDDPNARVITVTDAGAEVIDQSPAATSKDQLLSWADQSSYIDLVSAGVDELPNAVVPTHPTGGTDDQDSITTDDWQAALDVFTSALGPGQVGVPGQTTADMHLAVLEHCYTNSRVALLDGDDTPVAGTLIAAGKALRAAAGSPLTHWGGLWGTWANVQGVTLGTTRQVPWSVIQAGLIARSDVSGKDPNTPAAGQNGESVTALSLTATFNDTDREMLSDAGVNVARNVYGSIRGYGYRTLADPNSDRNWLALSGTRLVMQVIARSLSIGEDYVFDPIDGKKIRIGQFGGELSGMLAGYYDVGALYGATAAAAFIVNVGGQVNTDETIANGELRAVLWLRTSPFAELVRVDIVKVPTQTEIPT